MNTARNDSSRTETDAETGEEFQKRILKRYLREAREALVWKVEDLSEREARWPRVPSGNNLAGLVKHLTTVEATYLGDVVGRPWPTPEELVSLDAVEEDPQADFYLTTDETLAGTIDLYRRVWTFTEENIDALALDTPGIVPWWSDNTDTTLFRLIVHTLGDLARHAGHADILREQYDGAAGLRRQNSNIPDWEDEERAAYVAKLKEIADRYPRES
ncbi:DinB family protein [Myceligenerans pegani]|uniref:DinB family protein n=1 Tax=Myceligenerans pegani TaxID=2776917 RepID=A0ABR9N494_9MICO|nr:DinB family protein [Myceligenerans sp. TRM 65318]MBE1877898.1 DinB family protein [Myceligenerans sp. TRM 65318]MBE3020169.1 DinB family protein [Myceligenerans sp. TRM 65318]